MLASRTVTSTLDRMMNINRALDHVLASGWAGDVARVWVPALDVVEKKDAYQVFVELAGVEPAGVEINFEQNVLTIRGTKKSLLEGQTDADIRVYTAERATGAFERSIKLPEFVDGDQIRAEFANGVLKVTIPKAKAAQPRRIEIATR
jgi:HSP20 family protein